MQPTAPLTPPRFGGFARSPGESAYPDLWRRLIGLWAPVLGHQGITTLKDFSGASYDLATNGSMTNDDWVLSPRGYALDFDGSDDFLSRALTTRLQPAYPMTIAAWINPTTAQTGGIVWNSANTNVGYAGVQFLMESSQKLSVNLGGGSAGFASSNRKSYLTDQTIDLGKWHLVVVIIRSITDVEFYLDGVKATTSTTGTETVMVYTSSPFEIGRLDASTTGGTELYFAGKISDVLFWDRTLTSQEIVSIWGGASPLTLARRTAGKSTGGGTAWTLDIADTITFSDALTKSVGAVKTDALAFSDAIAKSVSAAKTDAITFTDALGNAIGKSTSDALSFADSSTSSSGKNIADAVTFSDASSNAAGKSTTDALSFSDAESNGTGKSASDALSFADASVYGATKSASDAISFSDAFTVPGFVTDSITFGDSVTTSFVAGAAAVCPPDTRYQRRPLGWMTGSGERTAFAEIDCETNKRKPIGFMTPDDTRNPFSPD